MSGMTEFTDIEAFLKHDSRGKSSGRNKTLNGEWKKQTKDGGSVLVYLHPKALPVALWQHNFPMHVSYKDKKSGEQITAYWSRRITCHDSEEILQNQWKRDKTGARQHPPQDCPLCKLVEWAFQGVCSGQLKFDQPLFAFTGAAKAEWDATVNAGPFAGINPKTKFLPDHVYDQMNASRMADDWTQKGAASARYVLTCLNVAAPEDGWQILAEGPSVGEKIQSALKDRVHAMGLERGNFFRNSKPVLITFDRKAKPAEMYRIAVQSMDDAPITAEIQALLETPVPALGKDFQPFDAEALRSQLEAGAQTKIPFDEIFGRESWGGLSAPQLPQQDEDDFPFGANVDSSAAALEAAPAMIPCDQCKRPMHADETKCTGCGTTYEIDDTPLPVNPNRRAGI
jgi:cytochrome c556